MTPDEEPVSEPWPIFYECPTCGGEVEAVAGEHAHVVGCPHCGHEFLVAADNGSLETPESAEKIANWQRARDEELNELRIRSASQLRRGAIRTKSYCIVAAGGCAVAAIQLAINAGKRFYHHTGAMRGAAYLVFVVGLFYLAWYFIKLAMVYHREAAKSALEEPPTPPDFSTLGNGSQAVENLEKLK